jgi:hypothetical protein
MFAATESGKTVEVSKGPSILEVAAEHALSGGHKISHGEKRNFNGDCEPKCEKKCDEKVITKCKLVPFEYELCEHKPIIRIKEVRA